MSEQHRAVLVLRDLEGLSYEEIADITEAPLGSVKGRLHRALTGTLAFGLGGRELAGQVSAGRHVHASYQLRQTISLNQLTAETIAFESAATVVRLPDGRTARVPNSHLLSSVVMVETTPP